MKNDYRRLMVINFVAAGVIALARAGAQSGEPRFTIAQVKSYPFPNELAAAPTGTRIIWALNEKGLRNIWAAEGPQNFLCENSADQHRNNSCGAAREIRNHRNRFFVLSESEANVSKNPVKMLVESLTRRHDFF